jgi:mRNA-degrading endonuclease YafQ of YafQ-DinJ toxin-antitoxin module
MKIKIPKYKSNDWIDKKDPFNELQLRLKHLIFLESKLNVDFTYEKKLIEASLNQDKREVFKRLITLLVHLLKAKYQPWELSSDWLGKINCSRQELNLLLKNSGNLQRYADAELEDAYEDARDGFENETGLNKNVTPDQCKWDLNFLLTKYLLPIECLEYFEVKELNPKQYKFI